MSSMLGNRGPTGYQAQGRQGPTGNAGRNRIPKGYEHSQISNYTPEQWQLFQQMFGGVAPDSYTARLAGGDQSLFEEMEAPAHRQFAGQIGALASRFSAGGGGRGALSSRRSSGFQNTATSAASNFAQELQARRQELQRGAIRDLHGMSLDLLGQRPYQDYLTPEGPSGWESAISGGLPIAGAAMGGALGAAYGGPGGGWAGAQLGGKIGSRASQGFFA
jgi:hypothetical protein